jgi:hypothetical protein
MTVWQNAFGRLTVATSLFSFASTIAVRITASVYAVGELASSFVI